MNKQEQTIMRTSKETLKKLKLLKSIYHYETGVEKTYNEILELYIEKDFEEREINWEDKNKQSA